MRGSSLFAVVPYRFNGNRKDWDEEVPFILYGYRCRQTSEGFSLFELMYGVPPRMQGNDAKPLLNSTTDAHRGLELMAVASSRAARVLRQNQERKRSGEEKAILCGEYDPSCERVVPNSTHACFLDQISTAFSRNKDWSPQISPSITGRATQSKTNTRPKPHTICLTTKSSATEDLRPEFRSSSSAFVCLCFSLLHCFSTLALHYLDFSPSPTTFSQCQKRSTTLRSPALQLSVIFAFQ